MAALFLPIALGLTRYASPKDPHKKDHSDPTKPLTSHEYWILGLTALFLATYVGTEVATGGFLVTFLEERGIADRDEAYLINSAFWGALSGMKALKLFYFSNLTNVFLQRSVYLQSRYLSC
jgi:fucose permease